MKLTFRSSFNRDLKKINDKAILQKIKQYINIAEEANNLGDMGPALLRQPNLSFPRD